MGKPRATIGEWVAIGLMLILFVAGAVVVAVGGWWWLGGEWRQSLLIWGVGWAAAWVAASSAAWSGTRLQSVRRGAAPLPPTLPRRD